MAPRSLADALVLSLQNGVENAPTIARHVRQAVVPAVVYVATAMPEPGLVRHFGRGDLVIGPLDAAGARTTPRSRARLQALVDLFATRRGAGPHLGRRDGRALVEADGELRLQRDLRARAGDVRRAGARSPEMRELQRGGRRARSSRWPRPKASTCRSRRRSRRWNASPPAMPGQLSSTAQDMARGKPSEIDHLNGFVARRGRELGVADAGEPGAACARQAGRGAPAAADAGAAHDATVRPARRSPRRVRARRCASSVSPASASLTGAPLDRRRIVGHLAHRHRRRARSASSARWRSCASPPTGTRRSSATATRRAGCSVANAAAPGAAPRVLGQHPTRSACWR